jgi:hypothetical protein
MKVSYMLLNKTGKARKIPPGKAWQWTVHIEDAAQLAHVLDQLKREIRENRLALANLRIERHRLDVDTPQIVTFDYKGPIIYDGAIQPQRIINRHALDNGARYGAEL